jgi:hypothetical protein
MTVSEVHPVHYVVKAQRNNIVVHMQEAKSHEDALRLKKRFEAVAHTVAELIEVHDAAETDLTTKTREVVEDIAKRSHP